MTTILELLPVMAVPIMLLIGWLFGRRGAKRDAALKDAREYQRTMERMQDADSVVGDASAAEWLRERGQR